MERGKWSVDLQGDQRRYSKDSQSLSLAKAVTRAIYESFGSGGNLVSGKISLW